MAKTIDWLVLAEKKSQAEAFAEGLFDLGHATGAYEKGGHGGKNLSSILKGEVRITRAQGHLYGLRMPEEQNPKYSRETGESDPFLGAQTKGDLERLHDYPVVLDLHNLKYKTKDRNAGTLAHNVVELLGKAKNIIIGTDFDAEGEMIAYNIINNNKLSEVLDWSHVYRANINSLFKDDIRETFQADKLLPYGDLQGTATPALEALRAQGYARSIADYEYGMTFSLDGQVVRNQMHLSGKSRYGRLKNSLMGEVRRIEIKHDNFVPSNSYRVDAKINVAGQELILKGSHDPFDNVDEAKKFLSSLPSTLPLKVAKKDKVKPSPKLWSRTELLIEMNKVSTRPDWGKVLQANYEVHKLMSYPRTASQYINQSEFDSLLPFIHNPDVQALLDERRSELSEKYGLADDLDWSNQVATKNHVDSSKVESHYAIIPRPNVPTEGLLQTLTKDELIMYKLNLYQTMAMYANDAVDQLQQLKLTAGTDDFSLVRTNAKTIGWRMLIDSTLKHEAALNVDNEVSVNVEFVVTTVPAKQVPLYTRTTLLKMLKKNNWGTEATRDSTIAELFKIKMFVQEAKGSIRPNADLTRILDKMMDENWIDLRLTKYWQDKLKSVKTMSDAAVFIKMVRQDTVKINNGVIDWYQSLRAQ